MQIARATMGLILTLGCVCLHADESDPQKITIVGTLSRMMAIGAESTGWMVQVDSEAIIDGKPISSIEVSDTRKPKQLEEFDNKRVKIAGKIVYRHGVETGTQPYVEIITIKADPASGGSSHAQAAPFSISSVEWLLEDLGGSGVIDSVQATLTFPETGKVAGNGSCNRFFGPAGIAGDHITLSPLGSSRMACPEAVMNQETAYMQALQAAERFERQDPYLLMYCKGMEKPLRFTRMPEPKPAGQ
jgi:heat shock protein HslJ